MVCCCPYSLHNFAYFIDHNNSIELKHAHSAKSLSSAGPEAEECQKLIAAHKECLHKEGFKVTYP